MSKLNKYLVNYVVDYFQADNASDHLSASLVWECEKMTENELHKIENEIKSRKPSWKCNCYILSFTKLEEASEEKKEVTTYIWMKLFDKEMECEVPVFIDTRDVVNTTTLKDGTMLVTVRRNEEGEVHVKTFILKTKSMFFSVGEDVSNIPTSWKNKAKSQPSLLYDGWLSTDNIE